MTMLLGLAVGLPLVCTLPAATALRAYLPVLTLLAPLPALMLAAVPGSVVEIPWLLIGIRLGVDDVNSPFLLLTGLLWLSSALYAYRYLANDTKRHRFYFFFLLTLAGNVGTVLALDIVSFYLFFTLMTFAAYGLIVHNGDAAAERAGRIYLVLAVIGEALLLSAILLIGAEFGAIDLRDLPGALAASSNSRLIAGLALAGFAIKMGVVPLHVWLPLAHPCAPTPASAVLSGILIKLGLLGWLRFLPLGHLALPEWGELCLLLGTVTTFYGVLVGLFQGRPKTVLAYSSVSQMGLLTLLLGIALSAPQQWPLILSTIILFSLHHGLAKAALFLGLSTVGKGWSIALLVIPALALIGAPLSSGAIAKLALKDQILAAPVQWQDELFTILTLSSIATTLLMLKLLYLAWPRGQAADSSFELRLPCVFLVLTGFFIPWSWVTSHQPGLVAQLFNNYQMMSIISVIILTSAAVWAGWWLWQRLQPSGNWTIPEGDVLQLCLFIGRAFTRLFAGWRRIPPLAIIRFRSFPAFAGSASRLFENEKALLVLVILLFVVLLPFH